jgi:hypothetical protein
MPALLHGKYLNELDDSFIRASKQLVKNYTTLSMAKPVLEKKFEKEQKSEALGQLSGYLGNVSTFLDEIIAYSLGEQYEILNGGQLHGGAMDGPLDDDEIEDIISHSSKMAGISEEELPEVFEAAGYTKPGFIAYIKIHFDHQDRTLDEEYQRIYSFCSRIFHQVAPSYRESKARKETQAAEELAAAEPDGVAQQEYQPTDAELYAVKREYPRLKDVQKKAHELGIDINTNMVRKGNGRPILKTVRQLQLQIAQYLHAQPEVHEEVHEPISDEEQDGDPGPGGAPDDPGAGGPGGVPGPVRRGAFSYNAILSAISRCMTEAKKTKTFLNNVFTKEVRQMTEENMNEFNVVLNEIIEKLDELDEVKDRGVYDAPTYKLVEGLIGFVLPLCKQVTSALSIVKVMYTAVPNMQGGSMPSKNQFQFYFKKYQNMPRKHML